jgi:hypothetical protein
LQPDDLPRRVEFCELMIRRIGAQGNFLSFVLATDEAGFTREGIFNARNTHVWADENPYAIRKLNFQREFSLNVWAGIINGHLLGPHIMPRRLNGVEYLNFLDNVSYELLEDLPLAVRERIWYLHDGAPCHYALIVREWLNNNFPERWIGRNGPVAWPPRSPDLNPCDFFLWGYIKSLVYATQINTIEKLRERVENAATVIRNNRILLGRVEECYLRRIESCLHNNGNHFEHLL